jgi:hypothetical protein
MTDDKSISEVGYAAAIEARVQAALDVIGAYGHDCDYIVGEAHDEGLERCVICRIEMALTGRAP